MYILMCPEFKAKRFAGEEAKKMYALSIFVKHPVAIISSLKRNHTNRHIIL